MSSVSFFWGEGRLEVRPYAIGFKWVPIVTRSFVKELIGPFAFASVRVDNTAAGEVILSYAMLAGAVKCSVQINLVFF